MKKGVRCYELLEHFKPALCLDYTNRDFLLGSERGYDVFYVPFELINPDAKLALVGITPGPRQMAKAYIVAQQAIRAGLSNEEVLLNAKQAAAFDGMRDRINVMLDHFEIPRHLGIPGAASLWNTYFKDFQPISVIPNAAFASGPFNGPFSEVLDVSLLLHQFEKIFIPSIEKLGSRTIYIAMGPIADEALRWCAARGVIMENQLLGYFPHASPSSGSQFAYFMRKKRLEDLKPKDPVRNRVRDLDAAYERIRSNIRSLFQS
jgi:hypothetical protein